MTSSASNCPIRKSLARPPFVYGLIIVISIVAVGLAMASEIFLGLEPCVMCIYQRWGFVIAAVFALIGWILHAKKPTSAPVFSILAGLAFLGNSALALYHSGVEQKWWVSAVEGCAVPSFDNSSAQSWLDNIMAAPSKPCDEIAWKDPIFGLTMANYNIALCLGMFLICMMAAMLIRKNQNTAYISSSSVSQ